jgi:biotin operon repressor
MTGLSRRQAMLLAHLLDADGAVVPYAELGDVVGTSGVADDVAIRLYVFRLRQLGLRCVETVAARGCRLTAVPPDWTLETVLAVLDAMRRDAAEPTVLEWRKAS